MKMKKFEAATLQEALDAVKKELGPEAIILQTRSRRQRVGLSYQSIIEVTAAISERTLDKKQALEKNLKEQDRNQITRLPAELQANLIDRYYDKNQRKNTGQVATPGRGTPAGSNPPGLMGRQPQPQENARQNRGQNLNAPLKMTGAGAQSAVKITATRYIDILDTEVNDENVALPMFDPRPMTAGGGTTATYGRSAAVAASRQGGWGEEEAVVEAGSRTGTTTKRPAESQAPGGRGNGRLAGAAAGDRGDDDRSSSSSPGAANNKPSEARASSSPSNAEWARELKSLQKAVTDLKQADSGAREGASHPLVWQDTVSQELFDLLILQGVERRIAYTLLKKAAFELEEDFARKQNAADLLRDQVANVLMQWVEVAPLWFGPGQWGGDVAGGAHSVEHQRPTQWIALVGPSGVGKTLTIAKAASQAAEQLLKVGLIHLGRLGVAATAGAFNSLATYAKIINLPFRAANSIQDLKVSLKDFRTLDLVFIDTQIDTQDDSHSGSLASLELAQALSHIPQVLTYLVLSSATRDGVMLSLVQKFKSCHPRGLIFSKLDEDSAYGSILNVSQKCKLPLVGFTTGKKIPDDYENASVERVADLLLDF